MLNRHFKQLSKFSSYLLAMFLVITLSNTTTFAQFAPEDLTRGVVAVKKGSSGIYVGWRSLGTDPVDMAFNLYRITDGGTAVKLNDEPLAGATNFLDATADLAATNNYYVVPVDGGVEQQPSDTASTWANNYLNIPLQRPAGGSGYSFEPNDLSTADLDGDGEYELVLKWNPTNAKDNSQDGYTGNTILDGYELDGTFLWRIDLGVNIRSGAHYTQFMVYDLDGDGKAEVACKTAPGSKDGSGNYLSKGPAASADHSQDYRNSNGYILKGPEYLTVFNGETGAEITTIDYVPLRGNVDSWGDGYGNRVDRFLAAVAYLDGEKPSLVMCRGYYTRTVLAAWDFKDGTLTQRWVFDTNKGYGAYAGQGNHGISVADVDDDGNDEIIYGAMAVDHDGTGLWNAGLHHGDAMHVADILPERPGLEKWGIHEGSGPGSALLDARTGEVLWITGNADVGRGVSADLTPDYYGMECWGGTDGLRSATNQYAGDWPASSNHVVWWDADLGRELLNGTEITKYQGGTLLTANNCYSNNGSKSNPGLQADILGDWREEVIWRTSDNSNLRIYTTTDVTDYRITTLMQDRQYRLAIVWQNVAYNQPPHTSFYLGYDMFTPKEEIPPNAPSEFNVKVGMEFFRLNWAANFEGDVAGYQVYKSTDGSDFEVINDTLIQATSYIDSAIALDILYKYYITAVDTDSNESNPSNTVNALATNRPNAPTTIKASMGVGKNMVYWDTIIAESSPKLIDSEQTPHTKSAQAAEFTLKHAYTFADGTATDTVAGANGIVVGGSFENGAFIAGTEGDYIQLPAADIAINTYSAITLEAYITAGDATNADYTMLSFFGKTVGSYGVDYYSTSVARGDNVSKTAISIGNESSPWETESAANGDELEDGAKHHVVSILNDTAIFWYVDGNLAAIGALSETNIISAISTEMAYLCKGGYTSDPTWLGSIHEFNIYEGVMDETTIVSRSINFPNDAAGTGTGKIIGYNVYYSTESGADYQKINEEPITGDKLIHTGLKNGTKYYYVVTTVDDELRESYYPDEISATPGNTVVMQAEDAESEGVSMDDNHTGFNGTGFANFDKTGYVQFNYVYSKGDGWFKIYTKHALGTSSRAGTVSVNDTTFSFTMEGTGEWTNFIYDTIVAKLTEGFTNTIRFDATGNDYGNLDEIIIGIKTENPNIVVIEGVNGNELIKSIAAYPNPFNSSINIEVNYLGTSTPSLRIFNIYGQEVNRVALALNGNGTYSYQWDGTGYSGAKLASGIYFVNVYEGNRTLKTVKVMLTE